MNDLTASVRPTYDSRDTGPRYHVTTAIDGRTLAFRAPVADPFVRQNVVVGVRDLLRGLLRGRLLVQITVGGDPDVMNDVLELDENTLIPGRTRHAAFHQSIHEKLRVVANGE